MLIGNSLGGAAVLAAASKIAEVAAVATIAAPSYPAHLAGIFSPDVLRRIEHDGEADVVLGGRHFRIQVQFLEDIAAQRLGESTSRARCSPAGDALAG